VGSDWISKRGEIFLFLARQIIATMALDPPRILPKGNANPELTTDQKNTNQKTQHKIRDSQSRKQARRVLVEVILNEPSLTNL